MRKAIKTYYHESDKVGQFVEDRLVKDDDAEERTAAVYEAFRQWCALNGCYPENSRNFNAELRKIATLVHKRPRAGGEKTTVLLGYRLKSEFLAE